jgi:hypothetical protein
VEDGDEAVDGVGTRAEVAEVAEDEAEGVAEAYK